MTRAIVVGAGHNGLVASFYLARAGFDVQIIEARSAIGGACKTEELIPGYRFSTCANYLYCLRPRVAQDMALAERGLRVDTGPYAHILENNRGFVWWTNDERLEEQIALFSPRDVDGYREWKKFWSSASDLLGPYLLSYPPTYDELRAAAKRMGSPQTFNLLAKTSWRQLVDSFFESPEMKAVLLPNIDSTFADPTLAPALTRVMTSYSETGTPPLEGYVQGGMGRLTELMAQAATDQGVRIRLNAPVAEVLVQGGRTVGISLADGEQIAADIVVSNADVSRTMLTLIPRDALDPALVRTINGLRSDVSYFKLHCAMHAMPEYRAFDDSVEALKGGIALVRSQEHLERSWGGARNGELPSDPAMEQMVPSMWDSTLAPSEHHTASFFVYGAAVRPQVGTWEDRKEEAMDRILGAIGQYAPNFKDILVDAVLFTPADLEERVMLSRGNIHHLDFSRKQILTGRPCSELARYRTPVAGLYLCGAGQHPGGEVTGAPGHNAAHTVLEDQGLIAPSSWEERVKAILR